MKFNTIRFKFGVLYTVILGIILIIYSTILYITLYHNLYNEFDKRLMSKTEKIVNTIDSYLDILGYDEGSFIYSLRGVIGLESEHHDRGRIEELETLWRRNYRTLGLQNDFILFLNTEGKCIVCSPNVDEKLRASFLQNRHDIQEKGCIFKNIKFQNQHLRVLSKPCSYKDTIHYIIQVGTSLEPIDSLMRTRLYYRMIPIPLILLFGFFLRNFFIKRILKPMKTITQTANEITHEDLHKRIETKHVDDEMRYLVDAFNNMIIRLEKSFRYVSELSSHIAHELKTPLAVIRGEIEISLEERKHSEEDRRVLTICLDEIAHMLKTIDDLLILARLDYRTEMLSFKNINLTEFMSEVYERSKLMASPKNITITLDSLSEPITICGDALHLRRLFFNLLDNAIKFTQPQGTITITVEKKDKHALVSITDTGIGITESALPKIFDKFYRIRTSEHDDKPGSGLGLSMVQTITRIHHGSVDVISTLGKGTTFTITLPLI